MTSAPPPPCIRCALRSSLRPCVFASDRPPWMSQLAEANFSEACVADRVCATCGGAAFCEHCCGDHHGGHDTSPTTALSNGHAAAAARRRDSFCTGCRVAFCSELCAHHNEEGHEVIPVDEYDLWYCARGTGSEGWFPALFDGIRTFRDEQGNVLVPLHWKSMPVPAWPSWFPQLLAADFSEACATDHVCNTCGGAGFCGHCCGEHHQGHDTAAATAKDKEPSAVHRRDSFCTGCRVAFCSDLCAHHAAGGGSEHEVIPIVENGSWYCARGTGTEPWFAAVSARSPAFTDKDDNMLARLQVKKLPMPVRKVVQDADLCAPWMFHLVGMNFSLTCARESVCNTCDGAAFCGHCCGEHHRGHDTAPAYAKDKDGERHRKDSFCTDCYLDFCSELCAHHAGHQVIPIDAYGDRHFVRSNGSEPWFTDHAFGGIETFLDKDGNLMVPLERKRSRLPEPGLEYRFATPHHGGATTPLAP